MTKNNSMKFSKLFRKFSILVERYPVELFTFETIVIILFVPSIKLMLLLFSGSIFTGIFAELMKFFFKENRPKPALERKFYKQTFRLDKRSFPSAHSAVSMFFPAMLLGNIMLIPTLVFAVIVMYSRIYIKSHHPIDILGGAVIGFLIGFLISTFAALI